MELELLLWDKKSDLLCCLIISLNYLWKNRDLWVSFPPESLCCLRAVGGGGNCGIREETAAWIHVRADWVSLSLSPAVFCGVWSCRTSVVLEMSELSPWKRKQHLFPCLTIGLTPHTVVFDNNAHFETYLPIIVAGWKVKEKSPMIPILLRGLCSSTSQLPLKKSIIFSFSLYKQLNFASFLYGKITLVSRPNWGNAAESCGAALACPETPKPPWAETASSKNKIYPKFPNFIVARVWREQSPCLKIWKRALLFFLFQCRFWELMKVKRVSLL